MIDSQLYERFGLTAPVIGFAQRELEELRPRFDAIDENAEAAQLRVIDAMQQARVDAVCFASTNGYGYDDVGRDKLEKVYAHLFGTDDALVRPQITCGTHALSLALHAVLRPGDELISPVGQPYETLKSVIGIKEARNSLAEYGVSYKQIELKNDFSFDYDAIRESITEKTRMMTIQRSKGYQVRPSFSVRQIGELIAFIKDIDPSIICMVDNCYGEFVEDVEPSHLGADLTVGSLIKNPGGGLAPLGGYIAGRGDLIEQCAYMLTSPGLGKEVGASLSVLPAFYQGLFLSPTVTASALKGAIFAASVYEDLGFDVLPGKYDERHDIIQAVTLGSAERVIAFCRGIQAGAPVDAYVTPEPWDMPGYDCQVIMAAGAFVSGSSIELSADAPIREPYAVYFQGGLTWPHAKLGIMKSLQQLVDERLVEVHE